MSDHEAGLRVVAENHFDLGFIDLWLPGLTGIDFVKAAKPKNPLINWFVMSGDFSGTKGSRALLDIGLAGAKPVVKGGQPGKDDRLKTLDQVFNWYLHPKPYTKGK